MIKQYCKDKRAAALTLLGCGAIFAGIFYLYQIPVRSVGYALCLCALFLAVLGVFDYRRYAAQHANLQRLLAAELPLDAALAVPQNLLEQDYTRLLEQAQAREKEIVSQADRSRTEMLDYYTLWAHQIKTPIAAMSVLLQTLNTPARSQLMAELFKTERYVEMVLEYLRMENMAADLSFAPYALDAIVRRAVKKYAPQFIHQKIALTIDEISFTVLTDEKWLCFVIEQVVSNALKYTHSGGKIDIYMERQGVLAIEDNGIGIAQEDLPRVFERGFTGFNGRMDKKSTGLGLYLCRRVLDKLGHTITMQSQQQNGTRVLLNVSRADVLPRD